MTLEGMRFIEEYGESAEALLSQYDYGDAKDKINNYIGEYKDENEYLEEYIRDLCTGLPKKSIDKITWYINYQKLNNEIFGIDLESIDYKGKVYIFKR